ncbi:hypothetical protein EV174_003274 [Coemansia sp. RSA 2320]|nr:hypothetical protein EV174_003274 [Coemansia sp. RSA 2320]
MLNDYKAARISAALQLPHEVKRLCQSELIPARLRQKLTEIRSSFRPEFSGPLSLIEGTVGNGDLPQITIAASNSCIPALLEVKQRTHSQSLAVYLGLPDTSLSKIDVLVLSRLDQMRLRYLGPARANLETAVCTLLPFSGALKDDLSPPPWLPEPASQRRVAVCIGSGVESAGFQLQSSDIDQLAEGLMHIQPAQMYILLSRELHPRLKAKIHSQLIDRLRHKICSRPDGRELLASAAHVNVVDYFLPDQPSPVSILASASLVVVNADDIASVSLAASLQRPVYIAGEESTTQILRNYYKLLDAGNIVRRFYPQGSRYSYMVMPDIEGPIDEFSAIRDHEPWARYDSQHDLDSITAFIRQRIRKLNE